MGKLIRLVELVQDAIDRGASSVEEVQKAIMNQPLEVLETIESLKGRTQTVRELQNRTIGSVYNVIRTVNRETANLAKGLLGEGKGEEPEQPADATEPAG